MADEEVINNRPGQTLRPRLFERWRRRGRSDREWAEFTEAHRPIRWRLMKRAILVLLILIGLYYPVGMIVVHKVDDDMEFAAPVAKGESHAVAIAAALIEREVDVNGWTPNDPFFLPSSALDNMPNFQRGIVAALSRFAIEMEDHIGRVRGSSPVDPDLKAARSHLNYSGEVWIFDFSTSWAPTASSEQQYRAARRALLRYNQRLAAGNAVFERRADNLQATIDRVAADLGSVSAQIDTRIREGAGAIIDTVSDDVFYSAKGRLYGYYLLLKALGKDYEAIIKEKQLANAWEQMMESLNQAAELKPLIVRNGAPDGLMQPNHLVAQGFYLLRARTQLKEITNILLK